MPGINHNLQEGKTIDGNDYRVSHLDLPDRDEYYIYFDEEKYILNEHKYLNILEHMTKEEILKACSGPYKVFEDDYGTKKRLSKDEGYEVIEKRLSSKPVKFKRPRRFGRRPAKRFEGW